MTLLATPTPPRFRAHDGVRAGAAASNPHRASRFLFYTNECVGLGHLRRTLTLARSITEIDDEASALVITGAPLAPGLSLAPRVDTVKLPMLARDSRSNLEARNLAMESGELHRLRSNLAVAAAVSFAPDVAVIDKLPLGLGGELENTLRMLKAAGTRIVLGLRDVEDDPRLVRRRWKAMKAREALDRYYDAVLVYGPGDGADALACVGWSNPHPAVHHVGYIGAPLPSQAPDDLPPDYLLATVGGGADGFDTLAAVIDAARLRPLPAPLVVVAGPLMDPAEVAELRRRGEGLDFQLFEARPDMDAVISGARAVVAMAGYNTVAELARAGHPAVLVPRRGPSREQLIRAESLSRRRSFAMIHPDELSPERMADELEAILGRARPRYEPSEHCGAARAARILCAMAEAAPATASARAV